MSNLDKLRRLSRSERWLLLQSIILLPVIHLSLLLLRYPQLRSLMERLASLRPVPGHASEKTGLQRALEIARIVGIASQHGIYKAGCLRRSLLVWWFLRREGIQSCLRFGVRLSGATLEAHAWVEHNGTVINDSPDIEQRYPALQNAFPSTDSGL